MTLVSYLFLLKLSGINIPAFWYTECQDSQRKIYRFNETTFSSKESILFIFKAH